MVLIEMYHNYSCVVLMLSYPKQLVVCLLGDKTCALQLILCGFYFIVESVEKAIIHPPLTIHG